MSAATARKKVLIIDDFEENVEILKEHLESTGFAVEVSFDGETALIVSQRFRPDVILLDIMLPRKDGYQVLEELRRAGATQQTPVVMMTAYTSVSMEQDRKEALRLGASGFLRKPFGLDELVDALNEQFA
jgi:two-component system, OmpR family, response regulator VicR